ncbi:MAG: Flp pilus assembly protein CpaB [Rhodobiaceae bacterium]|nr:Flp pilus assembly protein CpaB [Rhodobiaceae bacterium]MCC0041929.1 Flp pilus assembly protein CpaB [Rhodobiaceae bacterium]
MRSARLIILTIALGAGAAAFMLVRNIGQAPDAEVIQVTETVGVMKVLVAARDLKPGTVIASGDLEWQDWPESGAPNLIKETEKPDALSEMNGSVVRSELVIGEPVRMSKVVTVGSGGYLSAVLPPGKRAIATSVSPETGAGGFILPNDRVDVILTRREPDPYEDGKEVLLSDTVLKNVRVLAIDQTVEEQNGETVVVGSVATLELDSRQSETLALAGRMGELSLALRSILDGEEDNSSGTASLGTGRRGDTVKMVRFGVATEVTGGK